MLLDQLLEFGPIDKRDSIALGELLAGSTEP
jgi:hypothetical protein